jgi:hypothetical protein
MVDSSFKNIYVLREGAELQNKNKKTDLCSSFSAGTKARIKNSNFCGTTHIDAPKCILSAAYIRKVKTIHDMRSPDNGRKSPSGTTERSAFRPALVSPFVTAPDAAFHHPRLSEPKACCEYSSYSTV